MTKAFGGPVLLLDRSDINTDEIISARYLTEATKAALKSHCFEDLRLIGFDRKGQCFERANVLVTRDNFGCGHVLIGHCLQDLCDNGRK